MGAHSHIYGELGGLQNVGDQATYIIQFSDTLFSEIPTFDCGGSGDSAGPCSHTSVLGVLATETCLCSGDRCNAANATFEGQKAMSAAGSVRPAFAIVAAVVVAIAASIY